MAGLVGYASSDEDSDVQEEPLVETQKISRTERTSTNGAALSMIEPGAVRVESKEPPEAEPESASIEDVNGRPLPPRPASQLLPGLLRDSAPTPTGNVIGPSRPPQTALAAATVTGFSSIEEDAGYAGSEIDEEPLSPYSAERAAVRQLTLPRLPDFDIPGSPKEDSEGSAAESLSALNKKFAAFLELKQRRDTHFNARLGQSDAMRNPALMDKLMAFVGLPASGVVDVEEDDPKVKTVSSSAVDTTATSAQYATTLPAALWDPAALPGDAYRRSLQRLQDEAIKQRARVPGERVDFVSATVTATGETPAGSTTGKRKTRFD